MKKNIVGVIIYLVSPDSVAVITYPSHLALSSKI